MRLASLAREFAAVVACGVISSAWGFSTPARAQAPAPAGVGSGPAVTPLSMTNPYMNPYLNPYLNPALATQQPLNGRNAAMYLFMANSANGGIGSGRISGTRPAPGVVPGTVAGGANVAGGAGVANGPGQPNAANQAAAKLKQRGRVDRSRRVAVAEMPDSVARPGGSAAGFFNPGPVNTGGQGRFYNRRNTYFNSNGH